MKLNDDKRGFWLNYPSSATAFVVSFSRFLAFKGIKQTYGGNFGGFLVGFFFEACVEGIACLGIRAKNEKKNLNFRSNKQNTGIKCCMMNALPCSKLV